MHSVAGPRLPNNRERRARDLVERLERLIAQVEELADRLDRHARPYQEQAREEKARKLAAKREQAFLEPVLRRRGPKTITYARDLLREPGELRAELEHARWLARRLRVRLVVCAAADDGSASGTDPIVAVPPLTSRYAVATLLHELGHRANPCSHQRRRTSSGSTVCPSCEVAAWIWARANVYEGLWFSEHQVNLQRGLGSYRHYATSAERVEIDKLINAGPTAFAAQRLRLLGKCKS